MAGRCDIIHREVKMPRIDHSHIYLENDRLKEALDHFKDNLERRQYRQWMTREEEIQKLKKASGLLAQEEVDSRGNPIVKKPPSRRGLRPGHTRILMEKQSTSPSADGTRLSNGDPPKQSTTSSSADGTKLTNGDPRKPDVDSHEDVSGAERQRAKARGGGALTRARILSVRIPTVDAGPLDGGFSDLDSELDGDFMDSGPFGKTTRRPQAVLKTLESKINPSRNRNRYGQTVARARKFQLERMKEYIREKNFPPEWYITVVQPADVPSLKAAGPSSGRASPSHSVKGRRSRPQTSVGGAGESQTSTSVSRRDVLSAGASGRQSSFGLSTVVCHGQQTSKTKRQLLKMVNEDSRGDLRPKSAVEQRLLLNREKSKLIDHKVKDFVKSLEEINKKGQIKDKRVLDQQ